MPLFIFVSGLGLILASLMAKDFAGVLVSFALYMLFLSLQKTKGEGSGK
ncbi:hypothetical protein BR63_03125 [Thermanaerosceptrum fracticalcis]|uniref:Uncharacterized protein n=1 Tax=Thermanaerosceptrum fracticalcis TaxID=1712410 RepID=A0A7G6DZY8_THEFR|nr:hypothetical protein [Thermanaerosceptrum fracticalcis]QNB45392.1 hypothetical protein BR63_03125 [Thermanaerosceptrum fracticalcis]